MKNVQPRKTSRTKLESLEGAKGGEAVSRGPDALCVVSPDSQRRRPFEYSTVVLIRLQYYRTSERVTCSVLTRFCCVLQYCEQEGCSKESREKKGKELRLARLEGGGEGSPGSQEERRLASVNSRPAAARESSEANANEPLELEPSPPHPPRHSAPYLRLAARLKTVAATVVVATVVAPLGLCQT